MTGQNNTAYFNNVEKTGTAKRILAIMLAVIMVVTMMPLAFGQGAAQAKSKKAQYWLKVNRQRGVTTAYKKVDGKWKPVRAMLTSPGTGYKTPLGTFYLGDKHRRSGLMGGVNGKWCSRITGGVLFHSVWYYNWNSSSQSWVEFNRLGSKASHGCCRLSVIDAKWIYDNVKSGSKVTIYDSSKAGPLGKPKALKSHSGWDPTDPTKGNPNFKLRKARITISKNKKKTVKYGAKYKLKAGVKAYNPNANENVTEFIKVIVKKKVNGRWVKAKFSTKKPGLYHVTYKVKYKYCRSNKRSIVIKVLRAPKKETTEQQTTEQTTDQGTTQEQPEGGAGSGAESGE